jgi:hypothetical protein
MVVQIFMIGRKEFEPPRNMHENFSTLKPEKGRDKEETVR